MSHVSFYAIYDGHGGTECADFLSKVLFQEILQRAMESPNDIEGAIRNAFEECDKLIVGKLGNDGLSVGSTAGFWCFVYLILFSILCSSDCSADGQDVVLCECGRRRSVCWAKGFGKRRICSTYCANTSAQGK